MGVVLDKTGGSAGPRYAGRDVPTDPLDATREEPGVPTAGLVSQSRGRLYVSLHDIRVHGADGVLPGEYRPRDRRDKRAAGTEAATGSTRPCPQCCTGGGQARQDLRHSQQGNGCTERLVDCRANGPDHLLRCRSGTTDLAYLSSTWRSSYDTRSICNIFAIGIWLLDSTR